MSSPTDTVKFLEEHWHKKVGLVTVEVVFISALLGLLAAIKVTLLLWLSLPPLFALIVYFIWRYTTRPPIVPKDKIGFLVCITCSDEGELRTIVEDFIAPLRQLVKSGKAANSFHFIEMPQHFARQVLDVDSANDMRVRCKAHFMIYGRARKRVIDGKENHIIELEGAVAHQPVSDKVRENLAIEFAELLPRNVILSSENDLFSFQFTSEWAEIVARYIIGIAASYSGDIEYAETLYLDVQTLLQNKDQNFPVYRKLKDRIPDRLAELYEAIATSYHNKWADTFDESNLIEVDIWLDKIAPSCQNRQLYLTLKAITLFLRSRSVDEAIALLKKLNGDNSRIWQCNMAFLYAYKGDLKQAIRHYRYASMCDTEENNFYQVEDFINFILEQEASKYQLYYCLGFINWKIKGDRILALGYFETFLRNRSPLEYLKEKELSESWIQELSSV